jgi:hypothetical protein
MGKNLDRMLRLAERIADIAERRIKKELDALVRSKVISTMEARQLLRAAVREARQEQHRVRKFVAAELKRELARARPVVQKALAKKRKQFASYRKRRK